jgi:hypothetical protein
MKLLSGNPDGCALTFSVKFVMKLLTVATTKLCQTTSDTIGREKLFVILSVLLTTANHERTINYNIFDISHLQLWIFFCMHKCDYNVAD